MLPFSATKGSRVFDKKVNEFPNALLTCRTDLPQPFQNQMKYICYPYIFQCSLLVTKHNCKQEESTVEDNKKIIKSCQLCWYQMWPFLRATLIFFHCWGHDCGFRLDKNGSCWATNPHYWRRLLTFCLGCSQGQTNWYESLCHDVIHDYVEEQFKMSG